MRKKTINMTFYIFDAENNLKNHTNSIVKTTWCQPCLKYFSSPPLLQVAHLGNDREEMRSKR